MVGDEARRVIDEAIDFPETDRIVRVRVWSVPESNAYPDGIKYRMHYGTKTGDTIIQYDNSHPKTKGHERHTDAGVDPEYEYPGDYRIVLERFRREMMTYENEYD